MYKKRNNTTDASRTAWRRRRSTQATQLKVTEHVVGGAMPAMVRQVLAPLRPLVVMQ
jgi:hypothetical protein